MSNDTILHVEDEETYQTLVPQILNEQGFIVRTAGTWAEAAPMIEQLQPDLLILDINLPDADGYEICGRLRQEELWASLPILMATVRRHPEEWRKGFSAGASDYVSKPLYGPELVERVRSCLAGHTAQGDGTENPEVLMIRATLIGNRGAFDVFVRQYKEQLHEHILLQAKNVSVAEDVVSFAFLRAYEHLKRFRGQSSFYTWLYRIALYELHHRWRHSDTIPLHDLKYRDQAAIARAQDSLTSSASDPNPSDDISRLHHAFNMVPEPYRKMLEWHFKDGWHYAQIAQRLALPLATVKNRLFKARCLLRGAWRDMEAIAHR
jgi:RNA polymerase sigma factor (sigma-70 family)